MSSSLRNQTRFNPTTAHITAASYPHSPSPPPSKKQRMSLTQTYRLAHRARGKLSSEASRGDHDLRLLVGHANLLDSLMLELQDVEREQDAWFEQTVSVAATPTPAEPRRVQWSDQQQLEIPDASDEEDSDDDEEDDMYMDAAKPLSLTVPARQTRSRSPPPVRTVSHDDDDDDDDMEYDSDEENEGLSLVRTKSHSPSDEHDAVPELVHDSDDSDDDMSPESPPSGSISIKDYAMPSLLPEKSLVKTTTIEITRDYLSHQRHSPMVAAY